MSSSTAVLIDYRYAVDYCCSENHQIQKALDYLNKKDVRIDIRKDCWSDLTTSLTNVSNFFVYLRNSATKILKESDAGSAKEEFKTNIITRENLEGIDSFTLHFPHMPNITDLRDAVDEMGLEEFRAYLDTQTNIYTDAQSTLDILIDRKFEPGGQDASIFKASVEVHLDNDRSIAIISDAYIWATGLDGFLLTTNGSNIYSNKENIHGCMRKDRFKIVCAQDIEVG